MITLMVPSIYEGQHVPAGLKKMPGVDFRVCGMGQVVAMSACFDALRKTDWIILLGFAGSLVPTLGRGDVVEGVGFYEADYDPAGLDFEPHLIVRRDYIPLNESWKRVFVQTQDSFLKGDGGRVNFCHVVDMESYAVAYFCERHKIPYSIVRVISDMAGQSAVSEFLHKVNIGETFSETARTVVRLVAENLEK